MSKKKLLFTTPNFDTAGSGKVVYDLIKGLKETYEIHVACFNTKGKLFQEIESAVDKVHIFEFTEPGKPYYNLLSRIKPIRQFFRSNQFDIIHSWHYLDDWTEALAARLEGIPYVFTKKSMSWGGKDWWLRSKLANHVITINNDMNKEFYPNWKNVNYIPLGLDLNHYKPLAKSYQALVGLGIDEDDFVLMSVANMVPVKGIETALKAISIVQDPTVKYVLVGACEQEYQKTLNQLIADYSLDKQVYFVGKKTDVKPYLASADLFVIPTKNEGRKEGQPMAPVEAMACERLVAGTKIPGVKDILSGFEEFLFEANNERQLAEIIQRTIRLSNQEREDIAKRMRQRTEQVYGMGDFISSHDALYTQLISK